MQVSALSAKNKSLSLVTRSYTAQRGKQVLQICSMATLTYASLAARRETPRRASHTTTTHLQQHHLPTSRLTISTSMILFLSARRPNRIPSATHMLPQRARSKMTTIAQILTPPTTFANFKTSPMELTLCDPFDLATSVRQPPRPISVLRPLCRIPPPHRTVSRFHTPLTHNPPTTDLYHQGHMAHRTHQSRSTLSPP